MKLKYILIFVTLILLNLILVNAISIMAPNQINKNQNFDLIIIGSGFYCVEINMPESFAIGSDPSRGNLIEGIYKTCYGTSLKINIRPTEAGTNIISGKYTDGSGVKNLNSLTIIVNEISVPPSCPICPEETSWSNCENGIQISIDYKCSSTTNYQCIKEIKTRNCQMKVIGIPESSSPAKICDVGWVCIEGSNSLGYKSSDCSISSIQNCPDGCENNECKVEEEIKQQFTEDLEVDIIPEGEQKDIREIQAEENPNSKSIWSKIIQFFKKITDILIFWN